MSEKWKCDFGVIYIALDNGCRKVIAKTSPEYEKLITAAPDMLDALIKGIKRNAKSGTPQESMYMAVEKATGKKIEEVIK